MVSGQAGWRWERDGTGTGASNGRCGQIEGHVNGEADAVFEGMFLGAAVVFLWLFVHEMPLDPLQHRQDGIG